MHSKLEIDIVYHKIRNLTMLDTNNPLYLDCTSYDVLNEKLLVQKISSDFVSLIPTKYRH